MIVSSLSAIFPFFPGFGLYAYLRFLLSLFVIQDSSSLEKARDEVDKVLQGRLPTYEDIKNLKFLTRCIMESMRLYPHPPVSYDSHLSCWLNLYSFAKADNS